MKKFIIMIAGTLFAVFGFAKVASAGPIVIDGLDANEHGRAVNGVNEQGWKYMQWVLEVMEQQVYTGTARTVVDLGTTPAECSAVGHDARDAINSAFELSSLPADGWTLIHVDGATSISQWLANLSTTNTGILVIPTYNNLCGDLQPSEMDAINANPAAIVNFVNGPGDPTQGGAVFAMGERNASPCETTSSTPNPGGSDYTPCVVGPETTNAYLWLQSIIPGLSATGFSAGYDWALSITTAGTIYLPGLSNADISAGPWHNWFDGNFASLSVLATGLEIPGSEFLRMPSSIAGIQHAVILGGDKHTKLGNDAGQFTATKTGSLFSDADENGMTSPGDTLQYNVHLYNGTGEDVNDVVFTDTPDPNTSLVAGSVQATTGTVTLGNTAGDTSVRVDIGTLAYGQSVDILYHTTIANPFPTGVYTVTNQGVVSTTDSTITTTDPLNPGPTIITVTKSLTETTGFVDLSAASSVGQCVLPGSSYLVTWTVQNVGDTIFSGGDITAFVTGYGSTPVSTTIAPVAVGATGSVTQSVLVSAPVPYGSETITLTGNILTSTAVLTTHICAPDFRTSTSVVKSIPIFIGELFTYTWQITNTGDAAAPGVTGVLTLPVHALFSYQDSLTSTLGTPGFDALSNTVTWTGNLAVGQTVRIVFNARTGFGFPHGLIEAPFEVDHPYRPPFYGVSQYTYPYKLFFMLVLKDSSPSSPTSR
jgi:uncharacterized repeat protein (TIGR01451 family)